MVPRNSKAADDSSWRKIRALASRPYRRVLYPIPAAVRPCRRARCEWGGIGPCWLVLILIVSLPGAAVPRPGGGHIPTASSAMPCPAILDEKATRTYCTFCMPLTVHALLYYYGGP